MRLNVILTIILASLLCGLNSNSRAQTFCPSNINFENGNLTNWNFLKGTNNGASGISALISIAPIANRAALTTGTGTDYYGGFPVVDPVGGSYSLKLGNDSIGGQVDVARYYVHVPVSVNNYSLIYRYAVVFEDPGHIATNQPFFRVRVTDSATSGLINCASFTYVSQSGLPGFTTSAYNGVYGNATVYYKPWSTASLNLTGQAGRTLVLEFMAADCSQLGHMGYGYVDMSCGLFAITSYSCNPTTSLTAPPGFQKYIWYNSNFSAKIDSGQSISITTPTTLTQYHVVLTPYPGYGCPDTLHTQVIGSTLAVNAGPDTMLCNNAGITLSPTVTGNAAPFTYNWSPAAGLSCTSCLNTVASPAANTAYIFTATDTLGCIRRDTINVKAPVALSLTATNPLCYGISTGTASVVASQGTSPYTYSWNTVPAQLLSTAMALPAGIYTVTARDAKGCLAAKSISITQPSKVVAAIGSKDSTLCFGSADGRARATATGGTGSYTYTWNTTPLQTTALATGLATGLRIVTVTDSVGCSDTESVFIPQPIQVSAAVSTIPVLCKGGVTGSAAVAASGGTPPYAYALNSGTFFTISTFNGLRAGRDTVHLKDAHGCTYDTVITITEPQALQLSFLRTQPLCFGSANGSITIVATGGVPGYKYAIGSSPFGSNAVFSSLTAGTYALHIRDTNFCTLDSTIILGEPAALTVAVTPVNIACNGGSTGSVTITVGGGTPAYTYAVDAGAFSTANNPGNLSAGAHTVHIKDANGCTKDSTLSITQPAALNIGIAISKPLCFGSSNGIIAISGTGGTVPYSYALNKGSFGSSASFAGLAAGTDTLHLRDANGCTKDSVVILSQPALLAASATKTNVVCNGGASGSMTVSASGGTTPYSYSWTGSTSTSSSAGGLPAGSYTATVKDTNGCTASVTLTITQPPAITATMSTVAPVCNNTATGSATVLAGGGTGAYTYSWSTIPSQTSTTITNLYAGTYTVTIADAAGCTFSSSVAVPATPRVTVSVVPVMVSCFAGSDGSASASATGSTGPYTFTWNTSPVQSGSSVSGLSAGTYQVIATSAKGCMDSVTFSIPQAAKVIATAIPHGTCPGFSQGIISGSATGGTAPFSYQWVTSPVQYGNTANGLPAGIYMLIVTDSKGCTDTTTATIIVNPNPVIDAGADTVVCVGSGRQLYATGAVSYEWSPVATLSCGTCPSPIASPVVRTAYTVVGTDANGCKDTDDVAVAVIQHVPVRVDAKRIICEGDSVQLGAGGGVTWNWKPADLMDSSNSRTPWVHPAISTTFFVVIKENDCFTDTLSQEVQVLPTPTVDLGPDIEALIGAVVTLHAEVHNAVAISWKPAAGLTCSDCYDPQYAVRGKAMFVAKVTNELGCAATDTILIKDICDEHYFYFANTFSPNGDGQNDHFYPQGIGSFPIQHFMIYDRWGEIVFSASNISVNDAAAGWDGTYKSQPLKPDVYVYVMDAICDNGSKVVVRGDVTLIR